MGNAKLNSWMQWLLLIGVVATLILSYSAYSYAKDIEVPTAEEIVASANLPTAEDIAALMPVVDNSLNERLCELTDGCEFWEPHRRQSWGILNALNNGDAEEDFFDAMVDLTGIDEDYLVVEPRHDVDMKDYQIRAYSDKDKEDGNWEIKTFIKVRYYDSDEANSFTHEDAEYAYIVVTSILDEGEYEDLAIEEVSRSFEFD